MGNIPKKVICENCRKKGKTSFLHRSKSPNPGEFYYCYSCGYSEFLEEKEKEENVLTISQNGQTFKHRI